MPQINTSIKILAVILLAGFVLFNIVFIGYAAEPKTGQETEQPKYLKNPSLGDCPQGYEKSYTLDTGEQICKLPGSATPGAFDVKVSADTYKSAGSCETIGYPADKDGKCPKNTERIECPKDSGKYRCLALGIQTEVSQIEIQKYTTYSKIPCQPGFGGLGGTCPKAEGGPAAYIARLYQFGLMIAGLLAFGSIIYGSLKYILSAGNIGSTEEAKDIIREAIYGLVLLLGAYLILYTINPNLVNLRNPDVSPLDIASVIKKGALPEEQRLPTLSNEAHPLCQSGVSSGLTVQTNIKISEISDFTCLKCKANAVKSSVSDCECAPNFKLSPAGNQCVLAE